MLANNHICNLQSQNFKLLQQQWMQSNLNGSNISVLMPLRRMFQANPSMTYQFASEAYKVFRESGRCKESDFQDCYDQLATYGVTLSNFFLSYNVEKASLALYTSSASIIEMLATKGLLKGKKQPIQIEVNNIKKALLESNRIKSSIEKGNMIQAVRLDPEVVGTNVVFTATIPQSQLDLDKEVIIPYQAMDCAMAQINQILQDKILRVTMGDKVRVVTKNFSVLSMIYGEARAKYLISRTYDARIESFYVPSVGASIYTAGITNLKLVNVDKIEVVQSIQDIDLSEVKVDYTKAKPFFKTCLRDMSAETVKQLGDICMLSQYNLSGKETKSALADEYVNIVTDRDLYAIMKANPKMFPMDKYADYKSKFGNKFEQVDVPTNLDDLNNLLKTGVFKVLLTTRTGSFSTVIATNSTKELARIYGKDYFSKYESEGNRLRMLEYEIQKNCADDLKDAQTLTAVCDKYGLHGLATTLVESNGDKKSPTQAQVLQEIANQLNKIENRKTVVKQPGLVTCRSCEAYESDDGLVHNFYKNLDLKSIVNIIKLH